MLYRVTLRLTLSHVIKTFVHKGLEYFYFRGTRVGINPRHAAKLGRQLARLDQAATPDDMRLPGWGLHPLQGKRAGHWSVTVNGNWRVTFKFEGTDVVAADYLDYH